MKKLIQSKNWFYSKDPKWDPTNYRVQLYPIIINKAYRFTSVNISIFLVKYLNDKNVTFMLLLISLIMEWKYVLINRYNNQRLTPKRLATLYSHLYSKSKHIIILGLMKNK
ncbi:hypothetical protein [Spiroplasma poulsonii]|uniref:hypothetical protein n=1 Tax=Spiroplasma poulsonii TaxID=2138 RepID=UPI001F4D14B8|nr:hypothetical protein [Spiroplasma poulsonii]UNF62053.1 hypothetical protein MNU24_00890 [Spiroplasma poulsonii]